MANLPGSTFEEQMDNWINKTNALVLAVFQTSAYMVLTEAQKPVAQGGNMPVDTSFLRNSLQVEINQMPNMAPEGRTGSQMIGEMLKGVGEAKLGDVIFAAWGAEYALRIEFGFVGTDALGRNYNQGPRAFARKAAAKWPAIVKGVALDAKNRSGG